MNTQETFYLNKLRCEVAMQQALKSWQPKPQFEGVECPRCQSRKIVKYGSPRGTQRYFCNGCRRAFTERPKIECHCLIPGQQPHCQDCPHFKKFLGSVKQRVDSLRGLTLQELQRLQSDATPLKEPEFDIG
jgi:ribosomal protein S27E